MLVASNPAQAAPPAAPGAAQTASTPEPTEVAGTPEPTEVAGQDQDNVQEGDQSGPATGAAEPTEASSPDARALAGQARLSAAQAEQVALAANPGTTVRRSALGDENGTLVYEVELSNGSDVKVDAQSGTIRSTAAGGDTEQGGPDQEGAAGP